MSEIEQVKVQMNRLTSRLWVANNYDYVKKTNQLRARINHKKRAIPLLEQKIIRYVAELEKDINELDTIQRGRTVAQKIGWSSMCKSGHHHPNGCKGKEGTCQCSCHVEENKK